MDSLLFTLVRHDRYDYFFLTIPYSADVRQSDYHAESLLHAAIRSRNIDKETMSKLIDAGVDINACDQQGENAFQSAMEFAYTAKIVIWGLEIAADKMSTTTLVRIHETADEYVKNGGFYHKEVVEWIEKHIPERIPIARSRPVPAGVVDYD